MYQNDPNLSRSRMMNGGGGPMMMTQAQPQMPVAPTSYSQPAPYAPVSSRGFSVMLPVIVAIIQIVVLVIRLIVAIWLVVISSNKDPGSMRRGVSGDIVAVILPGIPTYSKYSPGASSYNDYRPKFHGYSWIHKTKESNNGGGNRYDGANRYDGGNSFSANSRRNGNSGDSTTLTELDPVDFEIFLIIAMIFHILISGILICGQCSSKMKGNAAISVTWIISAAIDIMFFTLTSAFIYVMIWPIGFNIIQLICIGIVAFSIKGTGQPGKEGQVFKAPQQMQQGQQQIQRGQQMQYGPQQNSQQFAPQQQPQQQISQQKFGPPPPYNTVAPQPFIQNSGNGTIPPQPGQTYPAVPEESSV